MLEGEIKRDGKGRGLISMVKNSQKKKKLSENAEGRRKGKIERRRESSVLCQDNYTANHWRK